MTRIDAASGAPKKTFPIAATELAVGGGALWASQRAASRVARIDPKTGTGRAGNPGGKWLPGNRVRSWCCRGSVNSLDGTVSRIDPETNAVAAAIPTGNGPTSVAVDDRSVWVSNQFDGTLVRIDPRTNRVVRTVTVGNRPQGVSVAAWHGACQRAPVRHGASWRHAHDSDGQEPPTGLDRLHGRIRHGVVALPAHDRRRTGRVQ